MVVVLASVHQLLGAIEVDFVAVVGRWRGASLIFGVLRESSGDVDTILYARVKALAIAITGTVL